MDRIQRQAKPCVGGKKNGNARNFDGNRSGRTAFHCGGGDAFHQRILSSRPGDGPQGVTNHAHTLPLGVGGVYESAAQQAMSTVSYPQHQQQSHVHGQARWPTGGGERRGKRPAATAAGGFDARGARTSTQKERLGVSMNKNNQEHNITGQAKRSDKVNGSCTFPSASPVCRGGVKASVATDLSTGTASDEPEKDGNDVPASTGQETLETEKEAERIIERLARSAEKEIGLPEKGQELCSESQIRPDLTWRRACKIGPGFENMRNTCYLNSILQCLSYLPPLAQHLLDNRYSQALKEAATAPRSAKKGKVDVGNDGVLKAVQKLIEEVNQMGLNATRQTVKPSFFSENIKCIGKRFRPGRQEDAHEFLRNLVERMIGAYVERSGVDTSASSTLAETTPVHRIFGGYLRNQLKCASCGYCSNKYEPFMDLSLDLEKMDDDRRKTRFKSVHAALGSFTATETLDAGNKWRCHGCEKLVEAGKTLSVFKPPNALVVHLKRFGFAGNAAKIQDHVHFEETLNLDVSGPERRAAYDLTGVVVHKGASSSRGHYLAYVRSSDRWAKMNDTIVTPVELDTVLRSKAYILFYTRRLASSPLAESFPASSPSSSGVSSPAAANENGPSPADGGDLPTPRKAKRSRKRGRKQEQAAASAAAAPNKAKASATASAPTGADAGTTAAAGAENGKSGDGSPRCKKPRLGGIPGATGKIGESTDAVEIPPTSPALVPERPGQSGNDSSGNRPGGKGGEKGAAVKDSAGEGVDAAPRSVSPSAPTPVSPDVEPSTDAVPSVAAGKRSREEGASAETGAKSRKLRKRHSCRNSVKTPGPSLSPPVVIPPPSAVSRPVAEKRAREDTGPTQPDADVSGAPLRRPKVRRIQDDNRVGAQGSPPTSAPQPSFVMPPSGAVAGATKRKCAREDGESSPAEEFTSGHSPRRPKTPRLQGDIGIVGAHVGVQHVGGQRVGETRRDSSTE